MHQNCVHTCFSLMMIHAVLLIQFCLYPFRCYVLAHNSFTAITLFIILVYPLCRGVITLHLSVIFNLICFEFMLILCHGFVNKCYFCFVHVWWIFFYLLLCLPACMLSPPSLWFFSCRGSLCKSSSSEYNIFHFGWNLLQFVLTSALSLKDGICV